jgi:putative aminopeptidase FrvX
MHRLGRLCRRGLASTPDAAAAPWTLPMSDSRFALLKSIIEAPSPVGLEGAMTFGVIEPAMRKVAAGDWTFRRFLGSASLVVSTPARQPNGLSIMVVGHADKIRMQVRHIDKASGKIYIDSDSFLPLTLLGNDVSVYSESVEPGQEGFARVRGTVEALGAIHFGDAKHRSGDKGVSPEQLYLDIGQHGPNAAAQIKALGIKPGDSVLLDRPVRRTVADDSFSGAYLDNGIGSFVVTELARVLGSAGTLDHVQMHFAIASHEEIGR